jgi:hypothetical protein
MKLGFVLVALTVSALVGSQSLAADLNPAHIGASCAPGDAGVWHFVNNQTATNAPPGTLTANFGDVGIVGPVAPSTVNKKTQHFDIVGPSGPLLSASTNLAGNLVLSDLTCPTPTPTPTPGPTPTPAPTTS